MKPLRRLVVLCEQALEEAVFVTAPVVPREGCSGRDVVGGGAASSTSYARSMVTLFSVITGGIGWTDLVEPLSQVPAGSIYVGILSS